MKVKTIDKTNLKASFFKVCVLAMAIFSSFSWARACPLAAPIIQTVAPSTNATCNTWEVSWSSISGADGYYLDVSEDINFGSGTFVLNYENKDIVGGSVTSHVITDLVASTNYFVRIRSYSSGCGASSYSSQILFKTYGAPALQIFNTKCNSVSLGWGNIANWTSMQVVVTNMATSTVVYSNSFSPSSVSFPFTVSGLDPSTTYSYSVTPTTPSPACQLNATTNFTTASLISAPTATSASNNSCYSFRANWNTVSGATGYYVDVATTSTFNAGTFVSGFNYKYVANGSSNYLDVTGLAVGQTYYYRVSSANECISYYSNVVTATTTSLAVPTASSATNVACNSFRANWGAVTCASGYYLEVATNSSFTNKVTGYEYLYVPYGYTNYYDVTGLSQSTPYYYRVSSAEQTISWPSNAISATTTACRIIKDAPITYSYNEKNDVIESKLSQGEDAGSNNGKKNGLQLGVSFQVSPNPTASTISFTCESNEPMVYQLMDVQGKLLQNDKIVSGANISLDAYSKGIYILRVLSSDGTLLGNKRIIKQ